MAKAGISVIIPTHNEEETVPGLLNRLTGLPGLEIIISDGGSTDRTAQICAGYPVTFVSGPPGRGRQLNAGAVRSTGDILFFLHADSTVQNRVFDDILAAVAGRRRWGCGTIGFDKNSFLFKVLAFVSGLRARLLSSCYGDQGIFCERSLFFSVGGFPDTSFLEDLCLSRRLRRYARVCIVPGRIITSTRRFNRGGILKTLLKMQLIKLLFALGVSPEYLAKMYRPVYKEGLCGRQ